MDPYDLPEEFSHLQAQDMSKLGFMQDLIRGIKKIAQTEEPKPIAVQEAAAPVGNSAAVQLLKRGNMALEDGDWARADEFFEQALNADDIPDDLSMLQSQDMSKIGFIQDLIRGIKKVLHKEEPKVVQQTVVTNQGGEAAYTGNLAALLDRGFMALEDGEWEKADDFFEQALNINSRAAEAYLGKFFAEQEAENAEAFVSAWLNAAKNVESVKREVSSVNERIDALVVSYQVEHYLEVAEIKARFKGFDNSYSSTLEAKQELLSEAEELFASNRLLLRAEQFG